MPTEKQRRQQLLVRLLDERELRSQAEVVDALEEAGFVVHEATVSRDLAEVGAYKARSSSGVPVYRVATERDDADATRRLDEVLGQFVTGIAASGNLTVIRTPPACAHPVASALDLAHLDPVVATVAGDDTVLVVVCDDVGGRVFAEELGRRTGLRPT